MRDEMPTDGPEVDPPGSEWWWLDPEARCWAEGRVSLAAPAADRPRRTQRLAPAASAGRVGSDRRRDIWSRRTALYRFFDAGGDLLYVGVAALPGNRWRQHSQGSSWWPSIATAKVEWFDNRRLALAAEAGAITEEAPRFNKLGQSEDHL